MSGRFSFKRGPNYDGLRRLPATYELRHGGKRLATIQKDNNSDGWFWYGDGVNTASNLEPLDIAKAAALAYFKATQQR